MIFCIATLTFVALIHQKEQTIPQQRTGKSTNCIHLANWHNAVDVIHDWKHNYIKI